MPPAGRSEQVWKAKSTRPSWQAAARRDPGQARRFPSREVGQGIFQLPDAVRRRWAASACVLRLAGLGVGRGEGGAGQTNVGGDWCGADSVGAATLGGTLNNELTALALAPTGRVILAGSAESVDGDFPASDGVLARLTADGKLGCARG